MTKPKAKVYKWCLCDCVMREIRITLEDTEFKQLEKKKDGLSWHDFILKLIEKEVKK